MDNEPSTILKMQKVLFAKLNPRIICTYSKDGSFLYAKNIDEIDFGKISLITNDLVYPGKPMNLIGVEVYLKDDLFPIEIPGLFSILYEITQQRNTYAFLNGDKTYTPFDNLTMSGKKVLIGDIIDNLASMFPHLPNTTCIHKTITLVFDPFKLKKITKKLRGAAKEAVTDKLADLKTTDFVEPKPIDFGIPPQGDSAAEGQDME